MNVNQECLLSLNLNPSYCLLRLHHCSIYQFTAENLVTVIPSAFQQAYHLKSFNPRGSILCPLEAGKWLNPRKRHNTQRKSRVNMQLIYESRFSYPVNTGTWLPELPVSRRQWRWVLYINSWADKILLKRSNYFQTCTPGDPIQVP